MQSNKDSSHIKRVKKVSYNLNLPEEVIELALFYTSEYIKEKISKVNVDHENLMSQEDFEKSLPIIKIPELGYLKPSYYKYKAIYNKVKLKNKNKEE